MALFDVSLTLASLLGFLPRSLFIATIRPGIIPKSDKTPMTVPTISGVVKPLLDEDFPVEALELEFGEETGPVANEDIAGPRLGLFRGWDYLENYAQAE